MNTLKKIARIFLGKFTKIQLAVLFVVIIFAFVLSDSNIVARIGYNMEINDLKGQIEYYKKKTEEDRRKLNELRSSKENVEKFARENYLMKKENEDIFIIE